MTVQKSVKEKETLFICLEPPKNHTILLGRLKRPILALILVVVLVLPFFPPPEDSSSLISLFNTTSGSSQYILSRSNVVDFIATSDNGYALLCAKEGLDRSISLELIKTNGTGDLQWLRAYGGFEGGGMLDQTKDGGYIIAGPVDHYSSNDELYMIKTNSLGEIQWNQTYYQCSDYYQRIAIFAVIGTLDDGFIVAITLEQAFLDEGIPSPDIYLLKITNMGDLQWDKKIHSNGDFGDGNFLFQTNEGGFVYAGIKGSSVLFKKLTADGNVEWTQEYTGSIWGLDLVHMDQPSNGSNFKFVLAIDSESDYFVVLTINSDGILQWERNYDLNTLLDLEAIWFYANAFLVTETTLVAMVRGHIDEGGWENYLFGMTTSGTILWKRNIGEKYAFDIIQDRDGNYVIAGDEDIVYGQKATPFVMIVDQSGNIVNENWFDGSNNDDWITQAISTTDGGFTLLGYTSSVGNGKIDGIMLKSDKNGEIEWMTTIGGAGDDCVTSIIQTNNGGFALTGLTDPFIDSQFNNNSTAWLTRVNENGEVLWNKTYPGIAWIESILKTDDEGFVLFGLRNNTSLFIEKTDRNGAIEWVNTQINLEILCMQYSSGIQTTDDNYLVGMSTAFNFVWRLTGLSQITNLLYLLKFNKSGELLWNFQYNSSKYDEDMYSIDEIIELPDGFIIIGRQLLHCGWHCHPIGDVPFLLKIDQEGYPVWKTTYKSMKFIIDSSMVHCSLTDLLLASKVSGIVTYDQDYLLGKTNWVFKTNQEGVMEWNQTYNGEIFSICQINDGGIILSGWDRTTLIDGGSSRDIWVAKINSSGSLLWEKTIDFQQG
ncbi:MAG: hypothetical protein JSV04_08445, partial [Candidatus Heimdallarchaeota archaeon]